MVVLFICLSIPILIFIMLYNYQKNSTLITEMRDQAVAKTADVSIENAKNLFDPIARTLRLLAVIAGFNPALFRTEESNDLLFRALTSSAEIDAVYVSFENGYHRVVTRIDEDRRRSDPKIPPSANWHSSYIDDFSAGDARARHRTFYDAWPNVVGGYAEPTTLDIRVLKGYPETKASLSLAVTGPDINPDTGYPVTSLRVPIIHSGEFIGAASANITTDDLSHFLANHRASANSMTVIADAVEAKIIAAPKREMAVQVINGKLQIATLANIANADFREANRIENESHEAKFLFTSPATGDEISASFTKFLEGFGSRWEAVTITPTNDFVGDLKATNRQVLIVIIALTAAELLLIYFLAARLTHPIESISHELKSVESLSFEHPASRPSKVREIAQLQSAASLLRNSLQSFSSFVPVDVVRGLIKSGIPLALGVEKRNLTVFFSDLENFSTHAEQTPPDELLAKMSIYFEQVSHAISDEKGTVDKFIGDGIMAFWGAPGALPDHVLRACAGAMRAARRMERVNAAWRAEGKPTLRIRIGLNTADVLVGNVGSTERFSYTVMGDGVNVAARLEGMNKTFGTTICISDSVFDAVASDVLARPLRRAQVKGRMQDLMVYELLGMAKSDDPEIEIRPEDKRLSEMTWAASKSFESGDFVEAARQYREILGEFPNDAVAKTMLTWLVPEHRPDLQ